MSMKISKVTVVYFSPTGGTKKAALAVAQGIRYKVEECDITEYDAGRRERSFSDQELVVFAIPVYGGRVPDAAARKIALMSGNGTPAVLMAVYGNRACDDALLELSDLVSEHGFVPAAAVTAVAEHSVMRKFAAGRPDADDERELKEIGAEIERRLEDGAACSKFTVPGNRPYREYNGIPFKPKAGKACTRCGICAEHCPVRAIPREQPDQTNAEICISCMRCISVCPSHARSLNKAKLALAETAMGKSFKGRKKNVLIPETGGSIK